MSEQRKQWIHDLLKKGIEHGDAEAVKVVDETQYKQHNPMTKEGDVGLAELFAKLAKTNPHVEILRIFSDGDYVFAHTEYDFSSIKICFEVFRFEGDKTVEHWDNLELKQPSNASGRSMIDGATKVTDFEKTESNRETVINLVNQVLIAQNPDVIPLFFNATDYKEHSPELSDDLNSLKQALLKNQPDGSPYVHYQTLHRTFAEGNFVLTACEGLRAGVHAAFYDLFRLEDGKVVEHWDTVEEIPPREIWNNQNGKF
ncbi:hypothetical protein G5S52_20250 [Grimontia sp. S25]|uniref:SnoaL-like domain-containing protein n=1 Tax=Grimontia sedimenti TaxID=2711294 RepID=A0A6M1RQT3_9GAMM|nr:hypothetical protein [Grimontia sedimenti]NGN99879.1 hypothetical protein [Grimontia sedimenti]